MQTVSHLRRFLINCTLMAFLFSLSACQSASQSTASISNSESSSTLSESCFLFSDASWDTPSTELESVEGKSISATSFLGGGDKSYAFDDVSFSDLIGTDTYTYRDSQLWKVTFHYQGHLETEKSEALVEKLKETYSFPTIDKSDLNGNGTGVWLEWHLDSVNITYMYVSGSTSNNNVIVLAYELPSSQILTIDSSSRSGDFRIGYWGDSIDTINLYETAEYMGTASGNSGMVYTGTISGYKANIIYYFDNAGKLYKGGYEITENYGQGALYITAYSTLKDNLISKYGNPISDKKKNISSLAAYADEGDALLLGYTMYQCYWETETSAITLGMLSENYDISIILAYKDLNHEEDSDTTGL